MLAAILANPTRRGGNQSKGYWYDYGKLQQYLDERWEKDTSVADQLKALFDETQGALPDIAEKARETVKPYKRTRSVRGRRPQIVTDIDFDALYGRIESLEMLISLHAQMLDDEEAMLVIMLDI